MKNKGRTNLLVILALAIAVALAAQPAKAITVVPDNYLLTLTENTSTNLSLVYTGPGGAANFLVVLLSPDHWKIDVLNPAITFNEFEIDWEEPEEPGEVNLVYRGNSYGPSLFVTSDLDIVFDSNGPVLPNGTTAGPVGQHGSYPSVPIFLQFFDNAAANEAAQGVPEAGSSLMLLALSSGALIGLRRRLRSV